MTYMAAPPLYGKKTLQNLLSMSYKAYDLAKYKGQQSPGTGAILET